MIRAKRQLTKAERIAPSFRGLRPASTSATTAARGSSRKRDTRCEILLRKELWRLGARYRVAVASLPGKPDVVFARERLAVFVDGDFWHGRNLEERIKKLQRGHNAPYWVAKIQRNVERDREHDAKLAAAGWQVLRLWEGDVLRDPAAAATTVLRARRSAASAHGSS